MTTPPKPHATRAKHHNGRKAFDVEARATFIERVEAGATIEEAATELGFARSTVLRSRKKNEGFGRALDRALDIGTRLRDRTVKFTEEVRERYLDEIRDGSKAMLAAHLVGVHSDTVRAYRAAHPEFARECAIASTVCDQSVRKACVREAEAGNATLIKFYMINKFPTEFRTERLIGIGGIKPDGDAGGPIEVETSDVSTSTRKIGDLLLRGGSEFAGIAAAIIEATSAADEGE